MLSVSFADGTCRVRTSCHVLVKTLQRQRLPSHQATCTSSNTPSMPTFMAKTTPTHAYCATLSPQPHPNPNLPRCTSATRQTQAHQSIQGMPTYV
mmetsp:Transcript_116734/g.203065  ORF Transcript_116734/g.203065 Transcript_116734/m.203065 type:complete len:95 (-) Transcript_116734:2181-2465(-)